MSTCSSFLLIAPGRRVYCTAPAGHADYPDFVVHVGSVRATLPDGREHAAMILWSDLPDTPATIDRAD